MLIQDEDSSSAGDRPVDAAGEEDGLVDTQRTQDVGVTDTDAMPEPQFTLVPMVVRNVMSQPQLIELCPTMGL